ncbi:MAG: type II toxin-antitoxin system death-on-curing family toxin [Chroococcidiopsidaceae cyanobacterium CP_BM_RX_35]|nr:type II toxin-antitoxin system death-on-curing family toxin [Chroococcidiopsidaceae cyanobacterium CP_BM_RX_35]
MSWYWLTVKEVITLHNRVVERYGGSSGVLNVGALESTLNRPQNLAYYEPESTICELAAAYGHGLVKNHCFLDGNKRTAFTVMGIFLLRNGYELTAPEVEAVEVMVDLSTGELSQAELAVWLTKHLEVLE